LSPPLLEEFPNSRTLNQRGSAKKSAQKISHVFDVDDAFYQSDSSLQSLDKYKSTAL